MSFMARYLLYRYIGILLDLIRVIMLEIFARRLLQIRGCIIVAKDSQAYALAASYFKEQDNKVIRVVYVRS